MMEYLGLPGIRARKLGPEFEKEFGDVVLYPRFTRLAMGLAHSVRLMQLIHEESLRRHGAIPPGGLLRSRGPAPVLGMDEEDVTSGLYIGDKYTVGTKEEAVGRQQRRMDDASEREGVKKNPTKYEGPDDAERKILGLEFYGRKGLYRPVAEDVLLLRKAGSYVADLNRVRGSWIEWVIGHCTWRFLARRSAFSQLNHLYRFAQRNRDKLTKW